MSADRFGNPRAGQGARAVIEIALENHLTFAALRSALQNVEAAFARTTARPSVMVDCRTMTGYEPAARELFVNWNRRERERIHRLAVVTDRVMWHLVVSGMALASGQPMKPFADVKAAKLWLQG